MIEETHHRQLRKRQIVEPLLDEPETPADEPDPIYVSSAPKLQILEVRSGEPEILSCDQCDKKFHGRPNLMKHLKNHNPDEFHCNQCFKVFNTKMQLQCHEIVEHTCNDGIYECKVCLEQFQTKTAFRNHHFQHLQENNWKCAR